MSYGNSLGGNEGMELHQQPGLGPRRMTVPSNLAFMQEHPQPRSPTRSTSSDSRGHQFSIGDRWGLDAGEGGSVSSLILMPSKKLLRTRRVASEANLQDLANVQADKRTRKHDHSPSTSNELELSAGDDALLNSFIDVDRLGTLPLFMDTPPSVDLNEYLDTSISGDSDGLGGKGGMRPLGAKVGGGPGQSRPPGSKLMMGQTMMLPPGGGISPMDVSTGMMGGASMSMSTMLPASMAQHSPGMMPASRAGLSSGPGGMSGASGLGGMAPQMLAHSTQGGMMSAPGQGGNAAGRMTAAMGSSGGLVPVMNLGASTATQMQLQGGALLQAQGVGRGGAGGAGLGGDLGMFGKGRGGPNKPLPAAGVKGRGKPMEGLHSSMQGGLMGPSGPQHQQQQQLQEQQQRQMHQLFQQQQQQQQQQHHPPPQGAAHMHKHGGAMMGGEKGLGRQGVPDAIAVMSPGPASHKPQGGAGGAVGSFAVGSSSNNNNNNNSNSNSSNNDNNNGANVAGGMANLLGGGTTTGGTGGSASGLSGGTSSGGEGMDGGQTSSRNRDPSRDKKSPQGPKPRQMSQQDMALLDPKRAKRILANRQSAARSKERKMRYITELERRVANLQQEAANANSQLHQLQREVAGVLNENNELKIRLRSMEQQSQLRDALNSSLRKELQRLRVHNLSMEQALGGAPMNLGGGGASINLSHGGGMGVGGAGPNGGVSAGAAPGSIPGFGDVSGADDLSQVANMGVGVGVGMGMGGGVGVASLDDGSKGMGRVGPTTTYFPAKLSGDMSLGASGELLLADSLHGNPGAL